MQGSEKNYHAFATFKNDDNQPIGEIKYGNEMLDDGGSAAFNNAENNNQDNTESSSAENMGNNTENNIDSKDQVIPQNEGTLQDMGESNVEKIEENNNFDSNNFFAHQQVKHEEKPHDVIDKQRQHDENVDKAMMRTSSHKPDYPDPETIKKEVSRQLGLKRTAHGNVVSDKDYIVRFFPNTSDMYEYDDDDNITGLSQNINMVNRKDYKKMILAQSYFFSNGFQADTDKSKELAEKLTKLKSSLSFTSQIRKKLTNV